MRNYFVCLLLLFASWQNNAEVFAGYDAFCGLPVVVGTDPQVASARTDQHGRKYIHIDPAAMSNWTVSRVFILAHECAHHLIGHTTRLGQLKRFYGGTAEQELEADCWAARKLASIGFDHDISRTILEQANAGHFSSRGYPSGRQRANNILNCAGGSRRCETITHQCNHPAHPNGDRVRCAHVVVAHPGGDWKQCQHTCLGPWGVAPCHPQGDVVQCEHGAEQHRFDLVQCQHVAHPQGHTQRVCP